METTNKLSQILPLLFVFALLTMGIVLAAAGEPSNPTNIDVDSNSTTSYQNGTVLNNTRGYIYTLTINESQQTLKWVGYVGNVNGEFALQDADADALYDWDIATITGELYATKEGPLGVAPNYDTTSSFAGGIPIWANLTCAANLTGTNNMITREELLFNHTGSDEDSYANTFKTTGFTNPGFYAGEKEVLDSGDMWNSSAGNCYGIHLNQNNADVSDGGDWAQVVLTDGTSQPKSAGEVTTLHYDIIYAAILENNVAGFDSNNYDFQVLLPQSGLEGSQPNVAYYFYIELI